MSHVKGAACARQRRQDREKVIHARVVAAEVVDRQALQLSAFKAAKDGAKAFDLVLVERAQSEAPQRPRPRPEQRRDMPRRGDAEDGGDLEVEGLPTWKSSRSMSSRDCWEAWSKTHSAAATEKLALSGRPIHGTCARNARASSSSIKPSSSSCVTKCTSACTKLPCSAANDAAAKRWHATRVYHSSWNVPAAKTRRSTSIGSAASLDEVGSDVGSGGAVFRASRRRAGV
eukprot:CAMPEP_0204154148 /NCGR_PEP_ID=MMETSP0361-20130328/28473_1 /ASSEMBLY_ACC=CAM_ASM_000343 /TAXON_ID=268821 /ORGANISM="Scrippsiella Hangoei, Strain SHTV-5" /LENGTH=229 /DNA_ID=CAMNT_0051109379 /DNA_START=405 /DNA_END=1092 /DNA_ORIENTATION=+